MHLDEYATADGTALASLIREGEVSAEEVYAAALEALAAVDPVLNAVASGPWANPLEHPATGPLAGVPFVLKDLGAHPQGVPIKGGTRLSGNGVVYPFESALVRRFREAGLAIAGTSTVPEFGMNPNTEALAYGGATRNPWDTTRSAGGSSGGSAALVASGAVPLAHASDGGGSIRIPAAFTGLVGLKPSRGRTSDGPDAQERLSGLGAEFAVTRTMRDCASLLDAVAGAEPGDKFMIREPARPWSEEIRADAGTLRIALHTTSWSDLPVDAEVADAVTAVGDQLEALGHEVDQATPEFDWDAFIEAMTSLVAATIVESVDALAEATGNRPGPDTLERTTVALYNHGLEMTALDLAPAMRLVNELSRAVGEFFTRWDVLVTPTVNVPPPPLGHMDSNDPALDADGWVRFILGVCSSTAIFNCTGTPALSLPLASTRNGLPIGVQFASAMCEEARLIRLGSQLEDAMPWCGRRPPVHAATAGSVSGMR